MTGINTAAAEGFRLLSPNAQASTNVHGGVTALASSSSTGAGTSSSSGSSTDVTGTDFLVLLVSELKNQDPTQPTDPTQYVQQLVGVNSLQQLIQINQDLGGSGNSTTPQPGSGSTTTV